MKYQIVLIIFGLTSQAVTHTSAKVEEQIYKNLEKSGLTNVLVRFGKADTKAAWDRFHSLRLTRNAAILDAQHAILKDHADVVQADITAILNKEVIAGKRHYLDQLWITTELIVRDIDRETVELLRDHPDVESLVAEQFIEPKQKEECFDLTDFKNTIQHQWHVENVQDGDAWAGGSTGTGIVIGNIDNGACYSKNNIGDIFFDWVSPNHNAAVSSDTNRHGADCNVSHSGTQGIGVAPNSRWIACRGCATASCSTFDLNSCGNFMACPTNTPGGGAQCSRAPQIVINSWGSAGDSAWFNQILTAWRNAGISVVSATGNSSYAYNTHPSPGDQQVASAVSVATNADVAAPGTSVASASSLVDTVLNVIKLIGKK